ncbi:MAG: GTPase HflX [Elusimicrobia bacterium]|nr:GTPase HflX [Elusimicrobiota bacterium]
MWDINSENIERAVLIGVEYPRSRVPAEESLSELYQLSKTAGAAVAGKFLQHRAQPHPASYIGKGKVQEIKAFILGNKVNLVIVDDDITPTQERNLEEEFGCKVVDRTRLILDIFALHASSSVGKLQVELAQLEYYLPRLKNIWTEFSRLGGGIGTRGPGEKKIEIDRRIISDRIASIKSRLDKIKIQRRDRRKQRKRMFKKNISLVGYTNSGKSTLMNVLTGAGVGVENKLFSTLSPTTRRLDCGKYEVLITDTVGFIRKLPHNVIEAFMATLEEVQEADLLIHVVDISLENFRHQVEAVENVLGELKVMDKPMIKVYNKIDKKGLEPGRNEGAVPTISISALTGSGMEELKKEIEERLDKSMVTAQLKIPQARQDIINSVYKNMHVYNREYSGNYVILTCQSDANILNMYRKYMARDAA